MTRCAALDSPLCLANHATKQRAHHIIQPNTVNAHGFASNFEQALVQQDFTLNNKDAIKSMAGEREVLQLHGFMMSRKLKLLVQQDLTQKTN